VARNYEGVENMSWFVSKKTYVVKWKKMNINFYENNIGYDLVEARSPAEAWKKVLKLHYSSALSLMEIEEVNPCEKIQGK
jgi:hypothetical protein